MGEVIPHNTQHKLLPQPVCYALFETDDPLPAVHVERVFPDWSTDTLGMFVLVRAFSQVWGEHRVEKWKKYQGLCVGQRAYLMEEQIISRWLE